MTSQSSRSDSAVHLQYRNGTYYGQISPQYKRHGKGMLILDTSTVIFADWKDDQIEGMYIYITDGIKAYGTIMDGKLDGYNIITSIMGTNNDYKVRTFYGMFRNDKIYGRCVMVDNDIVMLAQYNNNELQQILSKKSLRQRELHEVLLNIYPNNIYTIHQFLTAFIKSYIKEIQQLQQISRYQPCINYFSKQGDQRFYGFQQIAKPNKKYGILMVENEIISIGEHNNNLLQGIGRIYKDQHIYDGAFKNGQIDGIGIDFHRLTNKFILQINDGVQNKIEKGFGFPLRQILQFRKQFHLRSIYFYNDMAFVGLKKRFDSLVINLFQNSRRSIQERQQFNENQYTGNQKSNNSNNKSVSKRIQNYSPLRQKLSKYQMESDYIEDNSPIKNRPNEYRPIQKASTYFKQQTRSRNNSRFQKNDQSQQQFEYNENHPIRYNNAYQNDENSHSSNKNYNKSQDRYSQQRSKNKFQERQNRQKQAYNSIISKGNSDNENSQLYRKNNEKSDYSRSLYQNQTFSRGDFGGQSGQNINRSRKHTKDLVRDLQNQEKERRLTLDEIYEKSGLYGRKNKR